MLDDWSISCAIILVWMLLGFTDDKSTLISGNGLVPSGIIWISVDPDLSRHMASLGHNELKIMNVFEEMSPTHINTQQHHPGITTTVELARTGGQFRKTKWSWRIHGFFLAHETHPYSGVDSTVINRWVQCFKGLLGFRWFTAWGTRADRFLYGCLSGPKPERGLAWGVLCLLW